MVKVWRWLPWALLAAAPLAAEDGRRLGPPVPGVEVRVAAAAAHPVQAAPAPVPGPAQTPAAQADLPVLTLLDCIEAALLSNPEVGISREAIQKAAGQRRTANGALLPSLDFTYSETWQQQTKVQLGGGGAPGMLPGGRRLKS